MGPNFGELETSVCGQVAQRNKIKILKLALFFSDTTKFLSAILNFWLWDVGLLCWRGYQAHRSVRKVMMKFSKIAYLHAVEIMLVYARLGGLKIWCGTKNLRCGANSRWESCDAKISWDRCLSSQPSARPWGQAEYLCFQGLSFWIVFDLAKCQLFVTKVVHIKIVLLLGRLVASILSASSYEEMTPHWSQGCNMESLW